MASPAKSSDNMPTRRIGKEEAQAILDAAHVKSYASIAGKPGHSSLKIRALHADDKGAGIVDDKFWGAFHDGEQLREQFTRIQKASWRASEDAERALEEAITKEGTKADVIRELETTLRTATGNRKYPPEILNAMFGQPGLFNGSGAVANLEGPIEYTFDVDTLRQLAKGISTAAGAGRGAKSA